MTIKKVSSELMTYEVGKNDVKSIELTSHGSDKVSVYKVSGENGELIAYAGFSDGHEVGFE